jgi:hypothetical protein
MSGRKKPNSSVTDPLECSFCHKAQFVVRKLVSNPDDFPRRAYICDECILICMSILADTSGRFEIESVSIDSQERHPAVDNPEVSTLLRFVERWVELELAGVDSAPAFAEVHATARRIFSRK